MAHPRKFDANDPLIQRLREICLSFPDTYEKEAWGECTFRVDRGTMFAVTDNNHHGSGHLAAWIKAPMLAQGDLVEEDPARYFVPPYMGHKGWVGVKLDSKVKWKDVERLLEGGYQMSLSNCKPNAKSKAKPPAKASAKSSTRKKTTKAAGKKTSKKSKSAKGKKVRAKSG